MLIAKCAGTLATATYSVWIRGVLLSRFQVEFIEFVCELMFVHVIQGVSGVGSKGRSRGCQERTVLALEVLIQ